MFSHVMLGAEDIESSKNFYNETLATLGYESGVHAPNSEGINRYFYISEAGIFMISEPIDGNPATYGNGSTVGFLANDQDAVDAWHAAGIAHGGTTCEDPPGIRESDIGKYYMAYLRDPCGNKICALNRVED